MDQPSNLHIRKISQILSLTETHVQVVPRLVELPMDMNSLVSTAIMISQAQNHKLFDGTGSLTAYVEHKKAEMLLGMIGEEIIETKQEERYFSPNDINEKFKDLQFFFLVRTSRNEARGKRFVRNTVIACIPSSSSSSSSHSYEEKSSSLHVQIELLADVPMLESQESI